VTIENWSGSQLANPAARHALMSSAAANVFTESRARSFDRVLFHPAKGMFAARSMRLPGSAGILPARTRSPPQTIL